MKVKRIDYFPHVGKLIPEAVTPLLHSQISIEEIDKTITLNLDSGIDLIAELFQNHPLPGQKLFVFPYSKVVADINRLSFEKSVPLEPFIGKRIFRKLTNSEHNQIYLQHVVNYHQQLISFSLKHPHAVHLHWHSMDKYSTGKANVNSDAGGELRPHAQIVTRVDVLGKDLHTYFPNADVDPDEIIAMKLLERREVDAIAELFREELSKVLGSANIDVGIDRPYQLYAKHPGERIHAGSLPNIIAYPAYKQKRWIKQLAFEFRKDIFLLPGVTEKIIRMVDRALKLIA